MLVLADQKISQAKPRKGFSSAQPKLIELSIKFSHENFDPQIEDGGIQFSISLTEMFILASQKPHQLHLSHEKLHTETYTLQEKHNKKKKPKRKLFQPGLRYHRCKKKGEKPLIKYSTHIPATPPLLLALRRKRFDLRRARNDDVDEPWQHWLWEGKVMPFSRFLHLFLRLQASKLPLLTYSPHENGVH